MHEEVHLNVETELVTEGEEEGRITLSGAGNGVGRRWRVNRRASFQ